MNEIARNAWPSLTILSTAFLSALMLLPASGCSDDSTATDAGGASTTDTNKAAPDCAARCSSKVQACGITGSDATTACTDICGREPTSAQLDCLQAADCASTSARDSCFATQTAGGSDAGSDTAAKGKPGEECVKGECESGVCQTEYSPALCSATCRTNGAGSGCPASLPVCRDPLNSGTGSCKKE